VSSYAKRGLFYWGDDRAKQKGEKINYFWERNTITFRVIERGRKKGETDRGGMANLVHKGGSSGQPDDRNDWKLGKIRNEGAFLSQIYKRGNRLFSKRFWKSDRGGAEVKQVSGTSL